MANRDGKVTIIGIVQGFSETLPRILKVRPPIFKKEDIMLQQVMRWATREAYPVRGLKRVCLASLEKWKQTGDPAAIYNIP